MPFSPRIQKGQIREFIEKYDYAPYGHLETLSRNKIVPDGFFEKADLVTFIKWKSPRSLRFSETRLGATF
jgi:hypothetical protein